mgnify:CR=1 FL=1
MKLRQFFSPTHKLDTLCPSIHKEKFANPENIMAVQNDAETPKVQEWFRLKRNFQWFFSSLQIFKLNFLKTVLSIWKAPAKQFLANLLPVPYKQLGKILKTRWYQKFEKKILLTVGLSRLHHICSFYQKFMRTIIINYLITYLI